MVCPVHLRGSAQGRSRRMMRRGIPLATASVVPMTRNPARTNIALVPTNAMVRSIRPAGSTDKRIRLHRGRAARRGRERDRLPVLTSSNWPSRNQSSSAKMIHPRALMRPRRHTRRARGCPRALLEALLSVPGGHRVAMAPSGRFPVHPVCIAPSKKAAAGSTSVPAKGAFG